MTNRISTTKINDKEILIVDYSGCKESEMIELLTRLKETVISENKLITVISIYGEDTRVTVKYMDHVRKFAPDVLHLIEKQAIVGLDPIKKMILKGYNYLFKRNIRAFDTVEEAIDFLADEKTTDRDVPDYLR